MPRDDQPDDLFIQVSNENGLNFLERFPFEPSDVLNFYSKRRDSSGAWLIRIGHKDAHGRYHGHRHIVRCMSGELLGKAEDIVRLKLGFGASGPSA
jgi:hypothetical protein